MAEPGPLGVIRRLADCCLLLVCAVLLGGCPLPHANYRFIAQTDPGAHPPLENLLVWLEGDERGQSFVMGAAGLVDRWTDARGSGRAAVQTLGFRGERRPAELRGADGNTRTVFGLRCGSETRRCAYTVGDLGGGRPPNLDDTPYTIIAVVRPASDRWDNYFVMSEGQGCDAALGGINCRDHSALHLGWTARPDVWDPFVLRLGHYGDDGDAPFPGGDAVANQVILVSTRFQGGFGHVAYLRPGTFWPAFSSGGDRMLSLSSSGAILIGGTPFTGRDGPSVPDWHFEGDIFAILIYRGEVSDATRRRVEDYLRNLYGPR